MTAMIALIVISLLAATAIAATAMTLPRDGYHQTRTDWRRLP